MNLKFLTEIRVIILLNSLKRIYMTYFTSEFNQMNSEYLMHLNFQ